MAIIGNKSLTLLDAIKRKDPDGKEAAIIEIMNENNPVLGDMSFIEGNKIDGNMTTIRTGLPSVYWSMVGKGTPPSKSTTAQITEPIGILKARAENPVEIIELGGDADMTRINESIAFFEAMGQERAETVFYGNHLTDPKEFNGMSPRYSTLDTSMQVSQNVINATVTGQTITSTANKASIWLICWSPQTVTGFTPKGMLDTGGVKHKDLKEGDAFDSDNNRFRAYMDEYKWMGGLLVKNWQYAVRICNIDTGHLQNGISATSNKAPNLAELMIRAEHRIPNLNKGKLCWYMNPTLFQWLDIQLRTEVKDGGQLNYGVVDGKRIYSYRGIPVRKEDALLSTESNVTS